MLAPVALFLLQAGSVLAVAPDERLLHLAPATACQRSATAIVVCGKNADTYRLPKSNPVPEATLLPKAEWGLIGEAKMSVHAEQRALGPVSAPAAMVTIAIPF